MRNKFIRFVLVEPYFPKRLVLICAALAFLVIAPRFQGRQNEVWAELTAKQQLIAQIPALERELPRQRETAVSLPPEPAQTKKDYILQGISLELQNRFVVINNEIYREGEAIDQYVVSDVTQNEVTLYNAERQEKEQLYLYDLEPRLTKKDE